LYYDVPHCDYYVFAFQRERLPPIFLKLDFHQDAWGINRYRLQTATLLEGRRRYKCFYIPAPAQEAAYLTLKRIQKGLITPDLSERLHQLYAEAPEAVQLLLQKPFRGGDAQFICNLIRDNRWDLFRSEIPRLRSRLKRALFRQPIRLVGYSFYQTLRVLKRGLLPTGVWVVLLAPDGGGKTVVGDEVVRWAGGAFRRTARFHWRPGLLPPIRRLMGQGARMKAEEYSRPHRAAPHHFLVSTLRFLYYTADFILGYALKLRWLKSKAPSL